MSIFVPRSPVAVFRPAHKSRPRRRLSPAVILLGVVGVSGCTTWWNKGPIDEPLLQSRQLTMQATYARDRGDSDKAEELLTAAVNACPEDADAHFELAELLWQRQRAVEALAMFDRALQISPKDHLLWIRRGELQRELGMHAAARTSADQGLNLAPDYAPGWLLRARVARGFGNSPEAIHYYQRALGLTPDAPETLFELAQVQWNLAKRGGPDAKTRLQMALASTQRLLNILPTEATSADHFALHGAICGDLGRFEASLNSWLAAAERAPQAPHILFQLAEAQLRTGNPADALRTATHARNLDPGSPLGRDLMNRIRLATLSGGEIR
ncbi:MAG: tetratricopeptide repeat protein [Pirellulales bacterium]|nr:tetratricopeptide repeat protein [Pirellulales bacterium]